MKTHLSFLGRNWKNTHKKRNGFYISNCLKYSRLVHLEGIGNHIVIIDIEEKNRPRRIINIYRCFNPLNVTARYFFVKQLDLIHAAFNEDAILLGDLNIDYLRKHDIRYSNAALFDLFDQKLGALNLVQLIDFPTWSRVVGLCLRSSRLDNL